MGRRSSRLGSRNIRSGAWSSRVEEQQEQLRGGGERGWGGEAAVCESVLYEQLGLEGATAGAGQGRSRQLVGLMRRSSSGCVSSSRRRGRTAEGGGRGQGEGVWKSTLLAGPALPNLKFRIASHARCFMVLTWPEWRQIASALHPPPVCLIYTPY